MLDRPIKQLSSTAISLWLGLATPLLAQAIFPLAAVADDRNLSGCYKDREWQVAVYYRDRSYHYQGKQIGTDRSIQLTGATVTRDRDRNIYTWNNSDTRYRVVWREQDPDFIRVRVTAPRGKEVLNRLLSAAQSCD
jgi:hypothetical protein